LLFIKASVRIQKFVKNQRTNSSPVQPAIMSGGLEVIFGTAGFGLNPVEKNGDFLDQLEKAKIKHLDTARQYDGSEAMLSMLGAPSRFIIDSKVRGFAPNTLTRFVSFMEILPSAAPIYGILYLLSIAHRPLEP